MVTPSPTSIFRYIIISYSKVVSGVELYGGVVDKSCDEKTMRQVVEVRETAERYEEIPRQERVEDTCCRHDDVTQYSCYALKYTNDCKT